MTTPKKTAKVPSLLVRAKAVEVLGRTSTLPNDVVVLALAWVKGDVRLKQATVSMGVSRHVTYVRFALALREAYRRGLLTVGRSQ